VDASLSILILCFNHEKFIAQCLDSILSQKTNYVFELHVFDDCSSDNTREILKEYQANFPELVKLSLRRTRVGAKKNFIRGFNSLTSKYICYIDGDDYWVSKNKIEAQLRFLEEHEECVATASNTALVDTTGKQTGLLIERPYKERHGIIDLIDGSTYFHSSSILYRNIFKHGLPKSQSHPLAGDWFLSMLFAEHGQIHYINEVMSAYRINPKGIWNSLSELERQIHNIDGMAAYDRLFKHKYQQHFTRIWWACDDILRNKKRIKTISYLKLFFLKNSIHIPKNPSYSKRLISAFLYSLFFNFEFISTIFNKLSNYFGARSLNKNKFIFVCL